MAGRRNLPAVPEPERLPWERQPKEPVSTFSAFALYRDLGPQRSLSKVAASMKRNLSALKEASVKWQWVERADAYSDYVDARMREERENERARLERTDAGIAAALKGIVLRRVNGSPAAVDQAGNPVEPVERIDPNTLDAGDLARLSDVAVRIGRISAGLPTDFVRGALNVTAHDASRVAGDIIEIAQKFIPEDRQPRFFSELQAYIDSGRRL